MADKIELSYRYEKSTRTCHVYRHGEKNTPEFQTLYMKKRMMEAAGIPDKHPVLKVTVEEA